MLKDLFKKSKYATVNPSAYKSKVVEEKPNIPSGMWTKCSNCNNMIYYEDLENNKYVCTKCNQHFRISPKERIKQIFDKDTFKEMWKSLKTNNPIDFEDYEEKINQSQSNTGSKEAVVTGVGRINDLEVACAIMDSFFMMGSMGTVVGEKLLE